MNYRELWRSSISIKDLKEIREELGRPMPRIYSYKELDALRDIFTKAELLWNDHIREELKKDGDIGSCVVGAGLRIYAKLKGRRNICHVIIAEPNIAQSSLMWEPSVDKIIAYLNENGVTDVVYHHGRLN